MKKVLFVTLVLLILVTGVVLAYEEGDLVPPQCKPPSGAKCHITRLPIIIKNSCPSGLIWINGQCSTIVDPAPGPPILEPNQVWPSDLAPQGCNTQITINWNNGSTLPTMWSVTHIVTKVNQDNCGMSITYTNKGELSTLIHIGEGEFCDPISGACIDNHKWEGDNGTITWISKGIAPKEGRLIQGSIFNK